MLTNRMKAMFEMMDRKRRMTRIYILMCIIIILYCIGMLYLILVDKNNNLMIPIIAIFGMFMIHLYEKKMNRLDETIEKIFEEIALENDELSLTDAFLTILKEEAKEDKHENRRH